MSVEIVDASGLHTQKYRTVFVMTEERRGHYAGLREALVKAFSLTPAHADGGEPGFSARRRDANTRSSSCRAQGSVFHPDWRFTRWRRDSIPWIRKQSMKMSGVFCHG